MFVVSIPAKVPTNIEGYNFLASLDKKLSTNNDVEVVLNFSNCKWFDANLASALGAILDKYVHRCNIQFYKISPDIKCRLSVNGLLQALRIETQYAEKENYIPFRCFPCNTADAFKTYIDEWLIKKKRFPAHTRGVHDYILDNIYEIYANAIMHGECANIYCCGEFNANTKRLYMTIVDCGKTIPYNVNEYLLATEGMQLTHTKALEWAMQPLHTTKSNTGGIGLSQLNDFIRMNEGALQIVSGNGMLEYRKGKSNEYILTTHFLGTIVTMEFNFEDTKQYYMEQEEKEFDLNNLL